jgi:hypothetical protein
MRERERRSEKIEMVAGDERVKEVMKVGGGGFGESERELREKEGERGERGIKKIYMYK